MAPTGGRRALSGEAAGAADWLNTPRSQLDFFWPGPGPLPPFWISMAACIASAACGRLNLPGLQRRAPPANGSAMVAWPIRCGGGLRLCRAARKQGTRQNGRRDEVPGSIEEGMAGVRRRIRALRLGPVALGDFSKEESYPAYPEQHAGVRHPLAEFAVERRAADLYQPNTVAQAGDHAPEAERAQSIDGRPRPCASALPADPWRTCGNLSNRRLRTLLDEVLADALTLPATGVAVVECGDLGETVADRAAKGFGHGGVPHGPTGSKADRVRGG